MSELRHSVRELQQNAWKKMAEPSASFVVPLMLSMTPAVPDEAKLFGAGAALMSKLYEFTIGKKLAIHQTLAKSHWSILFHLAKRQKA